MHEKGKCEVAEAESVYTQICQNLSILLGKEAAMGQSTHMPHTCLCMPSPSKDTGCSGLTKYSKKKKVWGEVVKVSMLQQAQKNALCHPWKQPLLAASVVGLSMAVVWKEEEEVGAAKNPCHFGMFVKGP